jgi:hypothetical protein
MRRRRIPAVRSAASPKQGHDRVTRSMVKLSGTDPRPERQPRRGSTVTSILSLSSPFPPCSAPLSLSGWCIKMAQGKSREATHLYPEVRSCSPNLSSSDPGGDERSAGVCYAAWGGRFRASGSTCLRLVRTREIAVRG